MSKRNILIIVGVIILSVIVIVAYSLVQNQKNKNLIEVSGILEANNTEVPALIAGVVKEIISKQGTEVKKGDIILTLDTNQLLIRRDEAQSVVKQAEANLELIRSKASAGQVNMLQAKIRQSQANLQNVMAGSAPELVGQAVTRVQSAQMVANQAEKELESAKRLFEQEVISQTKLDEAQMAYNNAKANLKTAQDAYNLIKKGPTQAQINIARNQVAEARAALSQLLEGAKPAQIKSAQAQIEQAEAELKLIEQAIADSSIRSPVSGTISSISANEGEILTKGASVANILNLKNLWVKIFVPESKLVYLQLDQPAAIYPEALPKMAFCGMVSYIDQQGAFIPPGTKESADQQVFEVRVGLTKTKLGNVQMRPGMTVTVKIDTRSRPVKQKEVRRKTREG